MSESSFQSLCKMAFFDIIEFTKIFRPFSEFLDFLTIFVTNFSHIGNYCWDGVPRTALSAEHTGASGCVFFFVVKQSLANKILCRRCTLSISVGWGLPLSSMRQRDPQDGVGGVSEGTLLGYFIGVFFYFLLICWASLSESGVFSGILASTATICQSGESFLLRVLEKCFV